MSFWDLKVGDRVVCNTGVRGIVIKKYRPTASEIQLMVKTDDGREYHAPISWWRLY